jgi:hypothetical protein
MGSLAAPTVAALLLAAALAGCGSTAFGPVYTEEEQSRYCLLRGGWWRPDALMGGHCEFEATGFL